ncbi:GPW/gp25 family protein [Oligella sp. MSHR50489EDL]|uniref:GPW/gp25 family protein n=1 Tax=Oligella sp. MSHR50489EDL TaxID=3139409 RepID=UPI003D818BEC
MDRQTGRWIRSYDHLRQSIQILLATAVGTRVERRHIGSLIPELIDYPASDYYIMLLYAAIASAVSKHEPRLTITQIYADLDNNVKGRIFVTIEGVLTDSLENISLKVAL